MRLPLVCCLWLCGYLSFSQDPTVGLTQYTDQASGGYTFFCPATSDCYLIDECGVLVNKWERESTPGLAARFLDNGLMLRTLKTNDGFFFQASTGGTVELVDWDNETIGSYEVSDRDVIQHHDALMMPNGNLLLLIWEKFSEDELDMYGATTDQLWSEGVYEIERINDTEYEIVWEWNLKNHLIQEDFTNKENYAIIRDNIGKVDINYRGPTSWGDPDRWHCNALDYNPELDQILINSRNNAEVWIIDHSTSTEEAAGDTGGNSGKGGQLLYRWGNPAAYDRGNFADLKMYGSHGNYWIPEGMPNAGKIMFFNNGDSRPEGYYSTIEMIDPTPIGQEGYDLNDEQVYYPLESELVYEAENPYDFVSTYLSNAQQLQNGNVFINEGGSSRFFEVNTDDNSIVWEYISPVDNFSILAQGDFPFNASSFRAYTFAQDFPGFEGQVLTGSQPIELDPSPSICSDVYLYASIEVTDYLCNDSESGSARISVTGSDPEFKVDVFDADNNTLVSFPMLGNESFFLNDLLAGFYRVVVEDAVGVIKEQFFEIKIPDDFTITYEFLPNTNYCGSDDEPNVEFGLNGGTSSYQWIAYDSEGNFVDIGFLFSNNSRDEIFIPYGETFTIDIMDQLSCRGSVEITQVDGPVVEEFKLEVEVQDASSSSANDGSIIAHLTGGVMPYNYEWLNGNGEIIQDSIYSNLPPGNYTLVCTDAEGCRQIKSVEVDIFSSVENLSKNLGVILSPNPTSDVLNIHALNSLDFSKLFVEILDHHGKVVLETSILHNDRSISVGHISVGVYHALLSYGGEIAMYRFVKL